MAYPFRRGWQRTGSNIDALNDYFVRGLPPLLRLRPFQTATVAGRMLERDRRVVLTAIASGLARGLGLVTTLISVPLTIGYLGQEQYGLWMSITSLIAMLIFIDLGIGNGLIGAIAEADGGNDREAAQRYVSAAAVALCILCVLLLAILAIVYPFLPWQRMLNVTDASVAHEGAIAAAALLTCVILGLPLSLPQRIHAGFQEGVEASLWTAAGSVVGLIGLLLMVVFRRNLPWLVAATAAGPVLAMAANGAALYVRRPWLRPRLSMLTREAVRHVLRRGTLFLVLNLCVAVAYQSDNYVINQVLGPSQVTQYAVPFRLFSIGPLVAYLALNPLWAAYAEAAARGDARWVRRTLSRSIKFALLLSVVPALILVACGNRIVHLWVGNAVDPTFNLLLALALSSVIVGVSNPLAMFMNGLNIVKFQVVCSSLMAIVNIVVSVVMARRVGVSGVAYGTAVAQLLCILIPYLLYIPRVLSAVDRRAVRIGGHSAARDLDDRGDDKTRENLIP